MEILPFWSKYWYYIIVGTAVYFIVIIVTRRKSSSTIEGPVDDGAKLQRKDSVDKENCEIEESDDQPALSKHLEHVLYKYDRPTEYEIKKKAREFYNIANARRTLRFFSTDDVPKSVIRDLIRSAGTAPSGAHTEPWTFVAISRKDLKLKIREIIETEEELNYKKRMGKKWTTDLSPLRTNWIKEYLTMAPWLILVFKQTYGRLPDGRKKIHYYHEMSVSIACGILITAIQVLFYVFCSKFLRFEKHVRLVSSFFYLFPNFWFFSSVTIQYAGLVTLTSTPLNCGPSLRQLLGRPSSEKLCLLLPVGYPAADATVPELTRKSLDDILVEFD